MQTLPNGIKIFNATPHVIRFWSPGWDQPVEVEPDEIVNAKIVESLVLNRHIGNDVAMVSSASFVKVRLEGDDDQIERIIETAHGANALIVGSIIAAQAYPGVVFGMTPAPGYERVPPAEKRMNPDKFTVY